MAEMQDNRKVKDNHQQGIERVKQRKESIFGYHPQGGKMHNSPEEKAHWKRSGAKLTPREA